MKIQTCFAAALGALLVASPAMGASTAGDFAAKGPGRALCSAYVDAKAKNLPAYGQYLAFIEGYITAANRYEPNTYDLAPWHNGAALGMIVEQYCRANGPDSLAVASLRLAGALNTVRIVENSPLVEVREGEARTVLYESILRRAQAELKKKGLLASEPDGKYTPATGAAIRAFQTQAKLPVSGLPDPTTLWVLLNP